MDNNTSGENTKQGKRKRTPSSQQGRPTRTAAAGWFMNFLNPFRYLGKTKKRPRPKSTPTTSATSSNLSQRSSQQQQRKRQRQNQPRKKKTEGENNRRDADQAAKHVGKLLRHKSTPPAPAAPAPAPAANQTLLSSRGVLFQPCQHAPPSNHRARHR